MKNKKTIRLIIAISICLIYLVVALHIRLNAYWDNWPVVWQVFLGALPNFLAVIAASSFLNRWVKTEREMLYMPYGTGVIILAYEVASMFNRSTEIGSTFDPADVIATFLGIGFSLILERYITTKA